VIELKTRLYFSWYKNIYSQWAKSPKKRSEGERFLLIRHSKYSTMLSKIHTHRLLFRGFCALGCIL